MSSETVPLRATMALFALALPGIASSLAVLPHAREVPRVLLLIAPVSNVLVALLLGGWAAPRVGLRSRIVERLSGAPSSFVPREASTIAGASVGAGILVAALDHASRRTWQSEAGPPSVLEGWSPEMAAVGVLYGGVVEELVFRWGLSSITAWAVWRLAFRRDERAPALALAVAVVAAAFVFAAAHVPALTVHGPLGVGALARTFGLNVGLGVVFGALFIRRDLESAVLVHAGLHVGFAVAGLAFRALG